MYKQTNKQTKNKTVAVITSTIGRKELTRAIESVKAQTYPCRHYLFVDGKQFEDKVREMTVDYPELIVTYLPMNTGKNGRANGTIHAIAPFLVVEDIVCYLDDDNWYEPEHIENVVKTLESGADFAYSLRNFYTLEGYFIYPDDFESLGYWKLEKPVELDIEDSDDLFIVININPPRECMIDANTYVFSRQLAQKIAKHWAIGYYGDRAIYKALKSLKLVGKSTGKYTVNYSLDFNKIFNFKIQDENARKVINLPKVKEFILKQLCDINIKRHNNSKPWAE